MSKHLVSLNPNTDVLTIGLVLAIPHFTNWSVLLVLVLSGGSR
jgi:hypothetical protein